MSSSLASGIKRFCNYSKRLQTILDETKRCFDDINENGKNESGQLLSVELLQEEEEEVLSTAHKYPGIVVMGQNAYCKSKVVNEIFSRTIFPSFDNSDDLKRYRTVRFKHGENLCINLELPGDFSLAENLEAYNGPWNTIPHKDLLISDNEDLQSAAGRAVLEVSFNHQLLRYGCTLVVSACNIGFEDEIARCIEKMSPILVYAFQTDSFSTQEIQKFETLKELTHFQPICFVKVPPQGQKTSETSPVQVVAGGPFSCGVVTCPISTNSSLKSPQSDKSKLDFNSNKDRPVADRTRAENALSCDSSETGKLNSNINSEDALDADRINTDIANCNSQNSDTNSGDSEPPSPTSSPKVPLSNHRMGKLYISHIPPRQCYTVFKQLCKLGYLTDTPGVRNISHEITRDYFEVDSVLVSTYDQFVSSFTTFSEQTMQRYLVNAVTVLNNTHIRCLNTFIISAFDMAREVLVTPKKLEFAREKEEGLYKSLLQIAVDKGDEIRDMIEKTLKDNWTKLVHKANEYDFIGVDFGVKGEILTHKGLKICTGQIQELVLGGLNQAVAGQLVNSVDILRDSYTGMGILQIGREFPQVLLECRQKTMIVAPVKNGVFTIEFAATLQFCRHADCARTYNIMNLCISGTLTRCLESLEKVEQEHPDNNSTTEALKQILNAAYQVEINVRSSSTFINFLLERMKQLVQAMPWNQSPKIDDEWKKKVASEMLANLSAARLAKSISTQIKDRLNKSHEAFLLALKQLELKHGGRLDKIEEDRLKLRKVFAPRVAKVALESTSLKDLILYGMPQMGKEVGRGQYGVVYACDQWAGHSPCAIKSVVPPDDKHWNDLALEFFYTKHIPEHDRIVALKGSVIDYTYGGGTTPAVLLVMDRLQRDLYTAIKQQLDWVSRLQLSIDVVEGIRFLHSQGLVHRDIKLKNVLLDKDNRGKITDLGFCKPEAMMSGSIVGTPIHMAPELFTGRYDNSVDVYAFGILFWYICAGNVRLPQAFEQCANKDQLWTNVKKGLRPESLPVFDDECWSLMSECWENEPFKRPLLGDVQPRLTSIYERYKNKPGGLTRTAKDPPASKTPAKALKYKIKGQSK